VTWKWVGIIQTNGKPWSCKDLGAGFILLVCVSSVGRALSRAGGGFRVAMTGGSELCGRGSRVRRSTYGVRRQFLLPGWVPAAAFREQTCVLLGCLVREQQRGGGKKRVSHWDFPWDFQFSLQMWKLRVTSPRPGLGGEEPEGEPSEIVIEVWSGWKCQSLRWALSSLGVFSCAARCWSSFECERVEQRSLKPHPGSFGAPI